MKNNTDARTLRTRAQLKEAMLRQLETKSLHQITVSTLCRISQINRVTFYDHYKDVFDLANAIENDLIDRLNDTFRSLSSAEADPNTVSDAMFEFVDRNRRVMVLLLKGETGTAFRTKFQESIFSFFEVQLNYRYRFAEETDREELRNIMRYVAAGYDCFFTRYLEDPTLDYHTISALCTRLSTQAFLSREPQKR